MVQLVVTLYPLATQIKDVYGYVPFSKALEANEFLDIFKTLLYIYPKAIYEISNL